MECEEWRAVAGYEGLYEVSDAGNVRSLFRYKKVLKHNVTPNGYHTVELFSANGSKRLLVHRLVANAFLPNHGNLPQVNHKDENKGNNHSSNLEWCTAKYNMNYGTGAKRRHERIDYSTQARKDQARKNGARCRKPVTQYSKSGQMMHVYDSVTDAAKAVGLLSPRNISECCQGIRKTAGGYIWKYGEEE